VNLGLTYYTMGRRADALAEWQQILSIEPTNKSAAMYIAMVQQMPVGPTIAAGPASDAGDLADLFDPTKPNH
jgi:hypothetical protein